MSSDDCRDGQRSQSLTEKLRDLDVKAGSFKYQDTEQEVCDICYCTCHYFSFLNCLGRVKNDLEGSGCRAAALRPVSRDHAFESHQVHCWAFYLSYPLQSVLRQVSCGIATFLIFLQEMNAWLCNLPTKTTHALKIRAGPSLMPSVLPSIKHPLNICGTQAVSSLTCAVRSRR